MTQEEFSKKFKELFTGMIQVAYDFVNHGDDVEDIYVYVDMEGGMSFFNSFYRIKGKLVYMHEVNDLLINKVETGRKRTLEILGLGLEDVKQMQKIFEDFQGKVPTNMKLKYNIVTNQFDNDICYDLKHTNTDDLLADDIFDQWFEEVKNSSEK